MIRISLVIPTHNRAVPLLAALESVVRQSLPAEEWECVVVDNNSTDDTAERFAAFRSAHPGVRLRMVRETGPGVSYARNRGLREAAAPLVAFIDDDERVNADFLRAYADFFDMHPGAVVAGGCIMPSIPRTSGVDVPVGRDADRQSDGLRPRRAAFPSRKGARWREYGFPACGAGWLRGLRPLAGTCERRTDRRRGERLFRAFAAGRRDDLVCSGGGHVAHHSAVEAHRRLFPPSESACGGEPAASGADPPSGGARLPAGVVQMGRDPAVAADLVAAPRRMAAAPAVGHQPGTLFRRQAPLRKS